MLLTAGVNETLENFNDVADDFFRAALYFDRDHWPPDLKAWPGSDRARRFSPHWK